MARITVIILTFNETLHLKTCLESLKQLDAEVLIVDSGSTDDTLEIAAQYGCRVVHHEFVSYAAQYAWVLSEVAFQTPWLMRMDPDERLTPDLVADLSEKLATVSENVTGMFVARRIYFLSRWIRHGGLYPFWMLRIWRTGKGNIENRWADEHIELESGECLNLKGGLIDENKKGLTAWIGKHNYYSDKEMRDLLATSREANAGLRGQAKKQRWLKDNFYLHLPPFFRAFAYWFLRYVILFGFLDGKQGLIFHFLQGFWYRFLADAKVYEAQLASKPHTS